MKFLSKEKALERARKYCVYQERAHSEVRSKLYEWGLWKKDVEEIIAQLITENFLNEERFAIALAGGKFRIKKWGKVKIRLELKRKQVSDYCISRALAEIDDADYRTTLKEIIRKKSSGKQKLNPAERGAIARYAVSRGFEGNLVWEMLGERE